MTKEDFVCTKQRENTESLNRHNRKKFVRYKEAREIYSIGQTKLETMVREAGAVYKLDKVVLINCEVFERYLESFRVPV